MALAVVTDISYEKLEALSSECRKSGLPIDTIIELQRLRKGGLRKTKRLAKKILGKLTKINLTGNCIQEQREQLFTWLSDPDLGILASDALIDSLQHSAEETDAQELLNTLFTIIAENGITQRRLKCNALRSIGTLLESYEWLNLNEVQRAELEASLKGWQRFILGREYGELTEWVLSIQFTYPGLSFRAAA